MTTPLPRSLDTLPDESLPGYLLRLAHRLDLDPQRVATLTGLTSSAVSTPRERILDLDPATKETFAGATRLTIPEVERLLLLEPGANYPLMRSAFNGKPMLLRGLMQQEHWLFTGFTRCCPSCLAGDHTPIQQRHGGAWQRKWRLPIVFACPQHRRLLSHRCGSCGSPIQGAGQRLSALIPQATTAGIHPTQCRAALPSQAASRPRLEICAASLTAPGKVPPAPTPVLQLQRKLLDLLDAPVTAATSSLGHHVPAAVYFTDLRLTATLISASWPAALALGTGRHHLTELDRFLQAKHEWITSRGRDKKRPPAIVLHDQPPPAADACSALLGLADHILTTGTPDQAIQRINELAAQATTGRAWARRVGAAKNRLSPGLSAALQASIAEYQPSQRPRRTRCRSGPTRPVNFDYQHVPQRLPDAWFDPHFGHLGHAHRVHIRRAAAIQLVYITEGCSLDYAGQLLGLPKASALSAFSSLNKWLQTHRQDFVEAVNTLVEYLNAADNLINYHRRRSHLADWSIPPEDWRTRAGHLEQPARWTRTPIKEWIDYKRRVASLAVWTTITSGEHILAPERIMPKRSSGTSNQPRKLLIAQWHEYRRNRGGPASAAFQQVIDEYINLAIRSIDEAPDHLAGDNYR